MKDFYDIWLLSRQFNFTGSQLTQAIKLAFKQRDTTLSDNIAAFQAPLIEEKQVQWIAFRKRLGQEYVPSELADIINQLAAFLTPVVETVQNGDAFDKHWIAPLGWQ